MCSRQFVSLILTTLFTISAGQWNLAPEQRLFSPRGNVFPKPSRAVQVIMNVPEQPQPITLTPFPECLSNPLVSTLFSPETLNDLFNAKLAEEESKLEPGSSVNPEFDTGKLPSLVSLSSRSSLGDILIFHDAQLRSDSRNGPLLARVSTKVVEEIFAR